LSCGFLYCVVYLVCLGILKECNIYTFRVTKFGSGAVKVGRKKKWVIQDGFKEFWPIRVMEGGRKDRNELSQWPLRIPSEVHGLSAPFFSFNRRMLPQTFLHNWHIFFLTYIQKKYIHQKKEEVSFYGRWNKPSWINNIVYN